MKKSLLALAVLSAIAGAASAQTSVTIYGSFDGGVRSLTNVNQAGQTRVTMGSTGTYNSNRIGFRGVEDLGGGANAHFVLESGFNTGTGGLDNANTPATLFNRSAYVGLGGTWGSLDFGRQYSIAFKTIAAYDPMQYKYVGITRAVPATAGVRYNNDIQYAYTFAPAGVTVRAGYALGEEAGSTSTNSTKAFALSYAQGPLALGGAYTDRNIAGQSNKHYTLGGAYTYGAAKFYGAYTNERQARATTTTELETTYSWAGVSYSFTPQIQATYAWYQQKVEGLAAENGKRDQNLLGVTYAFSKRTNFYGAVDFTKLKGSQRVAATSTTPRDDQTGVSFGINHNF